MFIISSLLIPFLNKFLVSPIIIVVSFIWFRCSFLVCIRFEKKPIPETIPLVMVIDVVPNTKLITAVVIVFDSCM